MQEKARNRNQSFKEIPPLKEEPVELEVVELLPVVVVDWSPQVHSTEPALFPKFWHPGPYEIVEQVSEPALQLPISLQEVIVNPLAPQTTFPVKEFPSGVIICWQVLLTVEKVEVYSLDGQSLCPIQKLTVTVVPPPEVVVPPPIVVVVTVELTELGCKVGQSQ